MFLTKTIEKQVKKDFEKWKASEEYRFDTSEFDLFKRGWLYGASGLYNVMREEET